MYNIQSIFEWALEQIKLKNPRFKVAEDYEHVLDTHTGIEFHLYDKWSKVTHGDTVVITSHDLTQDECATLWQIKMAITPDAVKQEQEKYASRKTYKRREKLSDFFMNPKPVKVPESVVPEADTTPYLG